MPYIVTGEPSNTSDILRQDFGYEYPDGLDLRPGSPLHTKIKDGVMERARASAQVMSTRHKDWNTIDHTLTAYITPDEKELKVKDDDERKPISIVFPYSYTVLETLLSYFTAAFLQDPIFRYEGTGPEDVIGAILLEKIIALQCIKSKVGLNLHTMARDNFAYGFGAVTPTWIVEQITRREEIEEPIFMGFGKRRRTVENVETVFEGNALENIDPYLYLPDVNVPIHTPQAGEYIGWVSPSNYMDLLSDEGAGNDLFNVKYLKGLLGRGTSVFVGDNSGRGTKSGLSTRDKTNDGVTTNLDRIKMFIKIIPKDWKLGTSEYPEIWYFEVASDEIVICAKPANNEHNKFPSTIIASDFDGYSMAPISRIEMLTGMQGVLDFMFNSHVANVRKALHDMIIYDPYSINSNDLKNPSPGKLVRTRRPRWGQGVKDMVQQLNINDVTRGNVADSTWIVQWMDRVSGADAAMQGSLRQGGPERLTSTEFQGTMGAGVNRMERIAKVVGMQGMQDIGTFFGYHNRQMMKNPRYVKLAGDWYDVLVQEYGPGGDGRGRVKVDPSMLNINYDVIVRDGSVPGGNYSQNWIQLFQILGNNPELAQQFDVVRIFKHIARNLGAKDVNEFVRRGGSIQPKIMPDEAVASQVQQGNLVPVEGI